jgi:hypothetical protein
MLEGQFAAHKVTEENVRAAFDGRTLLAAQRAFYEELIDFFQSRGRNDRAKAVAKQMAMIDAAVNALETRIDGIDIDEAVAMAMTHSGIPGAGESSGGGAMSGASPDRSASIPTACGG